MEMDVARNGYLTTEMVHSDGGMTDVVYRGPLTPLPVSHNDKNEPYFNSDQALALATDVGGMSDISHASAFELGRLLAFSDHTFVKAAARWRQTLYIGQKVKLTFDNIKDDYAKLDINPQKINQIGNLSQSILKTTTQCMNQSNTYLKNITLKPQNILPPILPGGGATDPPPLDESYNFQAQQIADQFSMGAASETG